MNTFLLGKVIRTPYNNSNQVLDMMPPSVSAPKPSATFKPDLTTNNTMKGNMQVKPILDQMSEQPANVMTMSSNLDIMSTKPPVNMMNQAVTKQMEVKPPVNMMNQTVTKQMAVKPAVTMTTQPVMTQMAVKPAVTMTTQPVMTQMAVKPEPVCPDIKKDLEEIKKKLNKVEENESIKKEFVPQSSDAGLLLAKQAGLNPTKLVSSYHSQKSKLISNREYFDSEQTCNQVCNTVVDYINYTNVGILLILVFFIYLMRK
jgi:hypothetical protein